MEGKQQVYDDLANAIKSLDPAHTWTAGFVASGDTRNITQGFLYRDDVTLIGSVTPVSGAPYTTWVTDGALDFVRTPPTALFRFHAGTPNQIDGQLYALHFKSKRSSASCGTDDCTDLRELEAADLRDILAHHQAAGEVAIAGGDFNDTLGSSPIAILDGSTAVASLYYDLDERARWSYIFSGESEVLDHFYITANLLPANSGLAHAFQPIHVNADFPSDEHASDHDPLRARFSPCVVPAAPAGLSITQNGTTAELTWPAVPNSATYQVWQSETSYFTPNSATDTPLATVSAPGHSATNAIGDPTSNHYYVVTGVNVCGESSGISNRVAEFGFALVPGQ